MVGVVGFEPTTSCSQSTRAARLRHTPSIRGRRPQDSGPGGPSKCGPFELEPVIQRQRNQRDRRLLAAEGDGADRLGDDLGWQGAEPIDELLWETSMLRPVSPDAASIPGRRIDGIAQEHDLAVRSPISPTTTGPTWIATWKVGRTPKSRT